MRETTPHSTDVVIIGAGPAGLFAAFQLGLFGFKSTIVDARHSAGGQCAEYYADKPIYDVPAWPAITAQELIDRLLEQVAPFAPSTIFGAVATKLEPYSEQHILVELDRAAPLSASAVIIAAGWGLIGSSEEPPIVGWDIGFQPEGVPVDPSTLETSRYGIFAIGDICLYPGKLRLILSGFHEAALATQAIRKRINSTARAKVQYTSVSTELQQKLGVSKSG
ncbi:MAG: FAD-dependent oxidoreductase [Mesorhizobium sp.]